MDYLGREVSRYAFVCNYLKYRKRIVRKKGETHNKVTDMPRYRKQSDFKKGRKRRGGLYISTTWTKNSCQILTGQEKGERKVISKTQRSSKPTWLISFANFQSRETEDGAIYSFLVRVPMRRQEEERKF